VAKAAKQRVSLIMRLSRHLPQGHYLCQLGLVLGKINHAVATPRLSEADGGANGAYKAVQIAVNDISQTVTGRSRREHLSVKALLDSAKMPSVNAMVTAAVAVEAWKAIRSCDRDDGGKNPVGSLIFD
jgi:hypothetical protein